MGYIFFLELLAPVFGPYVIEQVKNKSALSFLKVHTSADENHLESAEKIWQLLDSKSQEQAFTNFKMTMHSYQRMLEQITDSSRKQKAA